MTGYPVGCAGGLRDGVKFPMLSALICIYFPREPVYQIVISSQTALQEEVYLTTVQLNSIQPQLHLIFALEIYHIYAIL